MFIFVVSNKTKTDLAMAHKEFTSQEQVIYDMLYPQLEGLKEKFLMDWHAWAENRWHRSVEYVAKYGPLFTRINSWWNKYYYQLNYRGRRTKRYLAWVKDVRTALCSSVSRLYSLDEWLRVQKNVAEETWDASMYRLVSRCAAKEFVWAGAVVVHRSIYPTGIELQLEGTDGVVLECRAIWAAEGSSLVTPHWRYLVTTKQPKCQKSA